MLEPMRLAYLRGYVERWERSPERAYLNRSVEIREGDASTIIEYVDSLSAQLAAAEADTARLDWLEKMAHDGENIGDIDIGGSWVTQVITVGDPNLTGIRGEGSTVRDAIDKAMR